MDLGLQSKTALVCASSKELGLARDLVGPRRLRGLHQWPSREAVECSGGSRRTAVGKAVTPIKAGIAGRLGRDRLVDACPEADTNNHGPATAHQSSSAGNAEEKFGRIVNITSAMVTTPRPSMELSGGARTGLTAVCKTLATRAPRPATSRSAMCCRVDTERQRFLAERVMVEESIELSEAPGRVAASLPAKGFGRPDEFGDACAYLCSTQAGLTT